MPRTLTISDLNAPVAERLESYAAQGDIPLDVAVKNLLAIALGVTPRHHRRKADNGLRRFRGTLSDASAKALLHRIATAPFSKVDPEDL